MLREKSEAVVHLEEDLDSALQQLEAANMTVIAVQGELGAHMAEEASLRAALEAAPMPTEHTLAQYHDALAELTARLDHELHRQAQLETTARVIAQEISAFHELHRNLQPATDWQQRRTARTERLEIKALQQERCACCCVLCLSQCVTYFLAGMPRHQQNMKLRLGLGEHWKKETPKRPS